jgi:epidermal growth factor receptor substrate 15
MPNSSERGDEQEAGPRRRSPQFDGGFTLPCSEETETKTETTTNSESQTSRRSSMECKRQEIQDGSLESNLAGLAQGLDSHSQNHSHNHLIQQESSESEINVKYRDNTRRGTQSLRRVKSQSQIQSESQRGEITESAIKRKSSSQPHPQQQQQPEQQTRGSSLIVNNTRQESSHFSNNKNNYNEMMKDLRKNRISSEDTSPSSSVPTPVNKQLDATDFSSVNPKLESRSSSSQTLNMDDSPSSESDPHSCLPAETLGPSTSTNLSASSSSSSSSISVIASESNSESTPDSSSYSSFSQPNKKLLGTVKFFHSLKGFGFLIPHSKEDTREGNHIHPNPRSILFIYVLPTLTS